MTAAPKTRTITLTGRPPVRIVEDEWPIVARAAVDVNARNGTPLPVYECAAWRLLVRQHEDGRALVYSTASAPQDGSPTHGAVDWRGGELLPSGADLPAAIQRVGADLVALGGAPERIIRACLADLPAEEI